MRGRRFGQRMPCSRRKCTRQPKSRARHGRLWTFPPPWIPVTSPSPQGLQPAPAPMAAPGLAERLGAANAAYKAGKVADAIDAVRTVDPAAVTDLAALKH